MKSPSSSSDEECKSQPEPAQGTPVQKQLNRDINYRIQHHSNSPEQRDLEKRSKGRSLGRGRRYYLDLRRELASLLYDERDLSMEPRISSDENKSDMSMLAGSNDNEMLTQSVVPLTSTSPIARLTSNDSYSFLVKFYAWNVVATDL
ncbi:hypothetical protein H257_18178 [Aphanomyces astaci]|uniref:Uncharacterized protein n=1 Tax=Aphanomyces astaci TaxID=112090 RepID=W4FC32_APHAT|nr:hypothetical protein H257_18178 [Aphanomyces astaci]ETV65025.1 hypothetical protein H257_18178 [Aphanomyces astaci]|eukprot:XP_009845488.1 hypothetical protein H257_18178 [Aphanomyces astaci]